MILPSARNEANIDMLKSKHITSFSSFCGNDMSKTCPKQIKLQKAEEMQYLRYERSIFRELNKYESSNHTNHQFDAQIIKVGIEHRFIYIISFIT